MSADAQPTRVGAHQTGDDFDESGLARAVVTDQAHDFAGRDLEAEAVEGPACAVSLRQAFRDEHPSSQ